MQGGSALSMDLPPYMVAYGTNLLCGLNTVGLRRVGLTPAERMELKRLYRALFRQRRGIRAAVAEATTLYSSAPARVLLDFVATSKRGLCSDIGRAGERSESAGEI